MKYQARLGADEAGQEDTVSAAEAVDATLIIYPWSPADSSRPGQTSSLSVRQMFSGRGTLGSCTEVPLSPQGEEGSA